VRKQARTSFFEKKEAKKLLLDGAVPAGTSIAHRICPAGASSYPRFPASPQTLFSIRSTKSPQPQSQSHKSFLLLFFKKEVLSSTLRRA
jgi:hypothetical protein